MESGEPGGRLRAWIVAIRPQTLPAGAAPVIVGTAVALADDVFAFWPALAALFGALLLQIGTNLANDYYDAIQGVDTPERRGFTRVTSEGLVAPARVRQAMIGTFLLAIALGTSLVYVGGIPIVVVGLAAVVCGITYAGGPWPYGSYGLGDLFVFVFFGPVAVVGTYYVQAVHRLGDPFPFWVPGGTISELAVVASLPIGTLATAILVVNNLRDIETDRAAGKYTLAVIIGPRLSRAQYLGLISIAYFIPFGLAVQTENALYALPLLSLPYALVPLSTILQEPRDDRLNQTLERTGRLLAAYAVLFGIGVMGA